ncbi:Ku protein [Arenimonas sp. MALMAid1274]|uniref:non-homologous end joining protein Ku n=1 Tax=Arenimonas sp. MALMAid1274 TaxID=3411630 RepID=UPI003BA014F4
MRPIWTGTLSFGLLNIPVSLMSGERRTDLQFRMLDSRDDSPVRYERVNSETGEEVPWKDVVKAFEYEKGSYVVLADEDLKAAAPGGKETVEMAAFVDEAQIDTRYFEKPYVLVPGRKAEKGYVLLRETLRKLGKVGVARVVVRTREYLCMVKPLDDALVLIILRFPQELVDLADFKLPGKATADYRISKSEVAMASQLIESMSGQWTPGEYRDDFRDRLRKVIDQRIHQKGGTTQVRDADEDLPEDATTNVVDFMSLLKKSLDSKKRTPAVGKSASRAAAEKPAARKKAPAKKATVKKAPAKKAASRADAGKPTATRKAAARKRPAKATRKSA